MLVCHCRGVSDRQIKRAVKNGACTLRDVARETGAGMRCGGCRSNVAQVVQEAMKTEFRPSSAASSMIRLEVPLAAEG
jgi:bacterioferritin-associated ferredoxin